MKKQIRNVTVVLIILAVMISSTALFYHSNAFAEQSIYLKNAKSLFLKEIIASYYEVLWYLFPNGEIKWNISIQNKKWPCDSRLMKITSITDDEIDMLRYMQLLEEIDATGSDDYAQLMKIRRYYPDIRLLYRVPVDGVEYDQDVTMVTVSSLTENDIELMDYLPELVTVNAKACTNYSQLMKLMMRKPELRVIYSVKIAGTEFSESTTRLVLEKPDLSELMIKLEYLPKLETVHLSEPIGDANQLAELTAKYSQVVFSWDKILKEHVCFSWDTEIDLSGLDVTVREVENYMRYFPDAEKVIMSDCGIDNEIMAAFRKKVRSKYKVVWTVIVTGQRVRTDDTVFHSSGRHVALINEQSYDLFYCEDMIVVDVGHSMIKEIDWVKGMPNLKYLILADNWLKDISAISTCKNLVYLELFINDYLTDISPLLGCTALEDLSVADCPSIDVTPLAQMTWLDNLWVNNCGITADERELLSKCLLDTHIEFDHGFTTGGGWRQLQNYFDMRDIMGMPYNTW